MYPKFKEIALDTATWTVAFLGAIEERETKSKKPFCTFHLLDGDIAITANLWNTEKKDIYKVQEKSVISVQLYKKLYNGVETYEVKEYQAAPDDAKLEDYLLTAPIPSQDMMDEIKSILSKEISETELYPLVMGILDENADKLLYWAAAKTIHHNCYGGLLYHMLRMLKTAVILSRVYRFDKELLYSAVILHDIGKLQELDTDATGVAEYTVDKFKVCIVDYNIDFGDVMGTLLYDPNKACMTLWADEIRGQLERMPVNKHGRHTKEQLNSIQYSATQIERFLQKNEASGLYALLAPTSNEDSMDISGEELEIMLNNIVENGGFDFVICDTGNNTRDSSYMTLLKADQVFLVLTQNFNTANCNNSLLKMLDALHFDMNKIGLIINKVQSKKSVGLGTDELEETFINPLTNKPYPCIALIKDTNDIRRASNNGEPLVYSPNNDFTKSIGKIVSQIVDEEHALEQPEKKGLFARLFGKRG